MTRGFFDTIKQDYRQHQMITYNQFFLNPFCCVNVASLIYSVCKYISVQIRGNLIDHYPPRFFLFLFVLSGPLYTRDSSTYLRYIPYDALRCRFFYISYSGIYFR